MSQSANPIRRPTKHGLIAGLALAAAVFCAALPDTAARADDGEPVAHDGFYYFALKTRGPRELLGLYRHTICTPKTWKENDFLRENRKARKLSYRRWDYKGVSGGRRALKGDACQVLAVSVKAPAAELKKLAHEFRALPLLPDRPAPETLKKTRERVLYRCEYDKARLLDCACVAKRYAAAAKARQVPNGEADAVAARFVRDERRNAKTTCTNEAGVRGAMEKRCNERFGLSVSSKKKRSKAETAKYCRCATERLFAAYKRKPYAFGKYIDRLVDDFGPDNHACR
jgi:hypothetical protein